jgi:hypothetical protein
MAKKRGNNEGTIARRKDGRWTASITIGRDPETGKPKRAWFYGKTRQEAAEHLAKALREKQQDTFVTPHKLTLGAWLDTWLQEYKKPKPGLPPSIVTRCSYDVTSSLPSDICLCETCAHNISSTCTMRRYSKARQLGLSATAIPFSMVRWPMQRSTS